MQRRDAISGHFFKNWRGSLLWKAPSKDKYILTSCHTYDVLKEETKTQRYHRAHDSIHRRQVCTTSTTVLSAHGNTPRVHGTKRVRAGAAFLCTSLLNSRWAAATLHNLVPTCAHPCHILIIAGSCWEPGSRLAKALIYLSIAYRAAFVEIILRSHMIVQQYSKVQ